MEDWNDIPGRGLLRNLTSAVPIDLFLSIGQACSQALLTSKQNNSNFIKTEAKRLGFLSCG